MKLRYLLLFVLLLPACTEADAWGPIMLGGGTAVSEPGGYDSSPATRVPTGDSVREAKDDWTAAGSKYVEVDDPVGSPDDATTYATCADANWNQMFTFSPFNIPPTATIDSVVVYGDCYEVAGSTYVRLRIYAGAAEAYDSQRNLDASWTMYDSGSEFATNPETASAWTVADINGTGDHPLTEFGGSGYGISGGESFRCTQLYIEVTFH